MVFDFIFYCAAMKILYRSVLCFKNVWPHIKKGNCICQELTLHAIVVSKKFKHIISNDMRGKKLIVQRRSHVSERTMTANFSKKLEGRRGGQKEERRRLNMRVSPNIWWETLARGFQRYFSLDTLLKSFLIAETRGRKFSRPKIFLKFKI